MSFLGFSLFRSFGSRSSDIPNTVDVENPLPPCPQTPNCLRITRAIDWPPEVAFDKTMQVLANMQPEKLAPNKEMYKINTVFKVYFFRDDMTVQVTEKSSTSSYLHVRSASRVGESDLWVNTRRVKKFLNRLDAILDQ